MKTDTRSALSVIVVLEEADAVAFEAPVDTADPSVEATRCSEADFRPVAVSDFAEVTFERPSWSCSMSHRAMAIKSSKS
jgi:hypothetical protein